MRDENKLFAILIIVTRVFIEIFKAWELFIFLNSGEFERFFTELENKTYCYFVIITIGILDDVILLFLIISTIICITNFNKGIKEVLNKNKNQQELNSSTYSDIQ